MRRVLVLLAFVLLVGLASADSGWSVGVTLTNPFDVLVSGSKAFVGSIFPATIKWSASDVSQGGKIVGWSNLTSGCRTINGQEFHASKIRVSVISPTGRVLASETVNANSWMKTHCDWSATSFMYQVGLPNTVESGIYHIRQEALAFTPAETNISSDNMDSFQLGAWEDTIEKCYCYNGDAWCLWNVMTGTKAKLKESCSSNQVCVGKSFNEARKGDNAYCKSNAPSPQPTPQPTIAPQPTPPPVTCNEQVIGDPYCSGGNVVQDKQVLEAGACVTKTVVLEACSSGCENRSCIVPSPDCDNTGYPKKGKWKATDVCRDGLQKFERKVTSLNSSCKEVTDTESKWQATTLCQGHKDFVLPDWVLVSVVLVVGAVVVLFFGLLPGKKKKRGR